MLNVPPGAVREFTLDPLVTVAVLVMDPAQHSADPIVGALCGYGAPTEIFASSSSLVSSGPVSSGVDDTLLSLLSARQ